MIIIYNHTSSKKKKYFVLKKRIGCFRTLKHKKSRLSFLTARKNYFGSIRVALLLSLPLLLLFGIWLYFFANNLSLDYQIHNLKQKIGKLEEQELDLQEQLSHLNSLTHIEEWAQENGFVEINKIGYLYLSNSSIAQATPGH